MGPHLSTYEPSPRGGLFLVSNNRVRIGLKKTRCYRGPGAAEVRTAPTVLLTLAPFRRENVKDKARLSRH
jgi:hypothetical protein